MKYHNADQWIAQRVARRRNSRREISYSSLSLHPDRISGIRFGDFGSYASAKTDLSSRMTLVSAAETGITLDNTVQLGGKSTLKLGEADRLRFRQSVAPGVWYIRQMFRLSSTHVAGKQYFLSRVFDNSDGGYFGPVFEYRTATGVLNHWNGTDHTVASALAAFRGVWHTAVIKIDGRYPGTLTSKWWVDGTLIHNLPYGQDNAWAANPTRLMDSLWFEVGGSQVAGTDPTNNYSHYHLVEFIDGLSNPQPYGPSFT